MNRMLGRALFGLLLIIRLALMAFSQTPAPSGRQGVLDQARGISGLNGGARASVQMVDPVDSNAAASGRFRAAIKDAFVYGNLQVPAGSTAIVTLVAMSAGNTRTYTVSLVSLVVNGQTVAVAGASPTLAGGSLGKGRGSVLGGGTGTSATGVTPTATGTRVYLPAGTQITFVLPPATPPANGQPAVAAAVVYENVQYQLQSCQREAPHIVCQIQITNLGTADLELGGGEQTYYVDQSGDKEMATSRKIANCMGWGICQLLPGIAMAGRIEFMDQDGRATSLARLQLWENMVRIGAKAVAQFSNVPVQ
jgi:hypothetical protein